MSTMNERLVGSLDPYERVVVADGLSIITGAKVAPDQILDVLTDMSDTYGGYGLVAVMEALRNSKLGE